MKWGEGADQRCAVAYTVPAGSEYQNKLVQLQAVCTPVGSAAPKLLSQQPVDVQRPAASAVKGAVLTIRLPDGSLLPKGARVIDPSGPEGIAGEGGHVYVKPALVRDGLLAHWLDAADGQERSCRVTLNRPEAATGTDQCTASVQWIEKVAQSQLSLGHSAP